MTSTDLDASSQEMTIRGSGQGSYSVVLFDDAASVCGGAPAMFVGPGRATGDTLEVTGTLTCCPAGTSSGTVSRSCSSTPPRTTRSPTAPA